MNEDCIGIAGLIVSLISLFLTFCTFCESRSTKHAVLSHKTRKEYEIYKKNIIQELEEICDEVSKGHNKPEYRMKLITMMGQMEGYKEHHNKTTKAALAELETLLGTKRKPDINVTVSLFGIPQKMQIPARSTVADRPLADVLSKLIGGLKQPSPKLFD